MSTCVFLVLLKRVRCCGSRLPFTLRVVNAYHSHLLGVPMYELLAMCFCATSICYVQLQTCSQGMTKVRTHLIHDTHSSSPMATFPKMHSNYIAHDAIKSSFPTVMPKNFKPHHNLFNGIIFLFLCPPFN